MISELTPRRLLKLQRKLNGIFVRRRDGGLSTDGIYSQLLIVERWLNRRRIVW